MTHHRPFARTLIALTAAAVLLAAAPAGGTAGPDSLFAYGQVVDYPLVFPVASPHVLGSRSHFWDHRYLGIHQAQDIMADKMIEVYAVASGTVTWIGTTCCTVTIAHDDGWESHYVHLNNDTPGTDDGQGWGIAPGVVRGARVERGQLIGWVGDSGNAEGTAPHLHFELAAPGDVAVDSFVSLQEAEAAQGQFCAGEKATRVDTNGDRRITGTPYADVIVGTAGDDVIGGGGGDDYICGREGDDRLDGGYGDDRLWGGDGDDLLLGGGGEGADALQGGAVNDALSGGAGDDVLTGGRGDDRLQGGAGRDRLQGGAGRDLLVASSGGDSLDGGLGYDAVSFAEAGAGITADLAAGTVGGALAATLVEIEALRGSPYPDSLAGDDGANTLRGRGGDDELRGGAGNDRLGGDDGNDRLHGGGGDDTLSGGAGGTDTAFGGVGVDTCRAEKTVDCEA